MNLPVTKLAEQVRAGDRRALARVAAAFTRARESGRPALIELVTDPEQISTRTTISKLRAAAQKKVDADQR